MNLMRLFEKYKKKHGFAMACGILMFDLPKSFWRGLTLEQISEVPSSDKGYPDYFLSTLKSKQARLKKCYEERAAKILQNFGKLSFTKLFANFMGYGVFIQKSLFEDRDLKVVFEELAQRALSAKTNNDLRILLESIWQESEEGGALWYN